ncbi:MAG TPA: hypothetical protein PK490_23095 [Prosthecobacter sp.]|nr:hypothetical protein [Prosthecobacter sp.]
MDVETPPAPAPASRRSSGCLKLLFATLLLSLVAGGLLLWKLADMAREGVSWLALLPEKMTSTIVTESFRQSVTEIASTNGAVLEVATLQTDETVTKHDSRGLFNDSIPLGTTVSEIRTPVFYRYHILLSDEWRIEINDGHAIVHSPAIRPSQPPSIRTEGMEKKSTAGWLRFNAAENLASLESGLTTTLEKRAGSTKNLNLVREKARLSVAGFVREWLLKDERGRAAQLKSLTIHFPDEAVPAATTLNFDDPAP